MSQYLDRITLNPGIMNGKPTIRNMRFCVSDVLALLASGMTIDEILADYPYLERADILACLEYASASDSAKVP
ncbi:MAG: DUF433 domain-containing protein [Chloroherpetonaceae bacterium]